MIDDIVGKYSSPPLFTVGFSDGADFAHIYSYNSYRVNIKISGLIMYGVTMRHGIPFTTQKKYPVLVCHNFNDKLATLDKAHRIIDEYEARGHEVESSFHHGQQRFGHWWNKEVNPIMFDFIRKHEES